MTKSTESLEYSALLSNSNVLCAKEEALEFWWVMTALSTLLYYIYNIENVGGWDMLSRLLAHSPLMPNGGSEEYETGKVFQGREVFFIYLRETSPCVHAYMHANIQHQTRSHAY